MGKMKEIVIEAEMLNHLGMNITADDILSMVETEHLSVMEVVDELRNNIY